MTAQRDWGDGKYMKDMKSPSCTSYRRHSEGEVGKYREHCAQWLGVLAALVKHAQVKAHDDLGAVPPLHVLFRSDDIWSALWLHQMSNMLLFFYITQIVGFLLLLFFPILTWNTEGRWRNLQELLWVLVKQLVNHTCFLFPPSFSSPLLWPFPSGSGFWLVLERRQRFTLAHW